MKEKCRSKRKDKSDKCASSVSIYIAVCSLVISVVFGILNQQFAIVNIVIYVLTLLLIFGAWRKGIILIVSKVAVQDYKYRRKQRRIKKKYAGNEDKLENKLEKLAREDEERRKFTRKGKHIFTVIMWICIGIVALLLFVQIMAIVKLSVEQGKETFQNAKSGGIAPTGIVEVEKELTSEQKEEMKKKRFILDEPDRLKVLTMEEEQKIFYVTDAKNAQKQVDNHIQGIYMADRRSTMDKVSTSEERMIVDATAYDIEFELAIEMAAEFRTQENYEAWLQTIPHSNDFEKNVLEKRTLLWEPEKGDTIFNNEMCFLVANDYQLLANEYLYQGGKPETIVYYYAQSIIWTERGLSYGDIEKGRKTLYHEYLKARYKDIADYLERNKELFGDNREHFLLIQDSAKNIYEAM